MVANQLEGTVTIERKERIAWTKYPDSRDQGVSQGNLHHRIRGVEFTNHGTNGLVLRNGQGSQVNLGRWGNRLGAGSPSGVV